MNSFRFQCWASVALLLASSSSAFVPSCLPYGSTVASSTCLNVAVDPRTFNLDDAEEARNEITSISMSKVMAEVETALQIAEDDDSGAALAPRSADGDAKFTAILAAAKKDPQMVATAIAGSALGVAAGSPLVLGAALGVAGSKLFDDSEEGLKNRKVLEQLSLKITHQVQGAVKYAQAELLEDEDSKDLSKMSQKILALVQKSTNELQHEVKNKAETWQEDAKIAPTKLANVLKEKLESEEFQREMKQAPGRAINAFKGFVESDEVKAASGSLWKALKATMESDEMKALKTRASKALTETLETKNKSD